MREREVVRPQAEAGGGKERKSKKECSKFRGALFALIFCRMFIIVY